MVRWSTANLECACVLLLAGIGSVLSVRVANKVEIKRSLAITFCVDRNSALRSVPYTEDSSRQTLKVLVSPAQYRWPHIVRGVVSLERPVGFWTIGLQSLDDGRKNTNQGPRYILKGLRFTSACLTEIKLSSNSVQQI